MKNNNWWQGRALTFSALQKRVEDGNSKVAFDTYVSKAGYNVEQLLHLLATQTSGEDMVFYSEEEHGALLEDYLAYTKKSGIKQIVYTNTHALCAKMGEAHPEFWQLDKDGKPYIAYDIYHVPCVNPRSPFHKEIIRNIEALCKRDIGGIFFDGPIMYDRGCYCETCQADFQKRFGHSIYEATPLELHKMSVDMVTEHIRLAREAMKAVNPDVLLYINNSALRPDVTGSNTRAIRDYVDMLGAEAGFYGPTGAPLWQTGAFMKHLECINGDNIKANKPLVNFMAMNDSGISEQVRTVGEVATTYASTLANGAYVWCGFHCEALPVVDLPAAKKAEEYNHFVLANEEYYKPSNNCARVALMWSEETANNYSSSVAESDFTRARGITNMRRGDHRAALISYVDMLERNHVMFDIVDEVSLKEGALSKYDALILPTVACLSDENANRIAQFVENGGNVLANYDVAMYDEDGTFKGTSKLAKVFGLSGDEFEISCVTGPRSVMFKRGNHPLLDAVVTPHFASTTLDMKWNYTDDTEVLLVTHPPKMSVYGDKPEERYPTLVAHKYGKGCGYYFCGNFGEHYPAGNFAEFRQLVKGFCDLSSRPTVQCDNKGAYEVVLRRQEDKYLLHIVNKTGGQQRPIESITPLYDITFNVNLEGFGIDKDAYKIFTLRGGNLANVSQNGNTVSFTLDKLDEYEVVVLE